MGLSSVHLVSLGSTVEGFQCVTAVLFAETLSSKRQNKVVSLDKKLHSTVSLPPGEQMGIVDTNESPEYDTILWTTMRKKKCAYQWGVHIKLVNFRGIVWFATKKPVHNNKMSGLSVPWCG